MAVPNPEQELQIRAIQGEFPDIVEFIGAQKDDLVKYVKGGYLQELDDFSATHCVNEHFLEKLKILNGTYVLPLSVNYRGIFYNKGCWKRTDTRFLLHMQSLFIRCSK